jgi:endonuclease G
VSIFKDQLINFSYLPHEELIGKTIYVTGKVTDFNGTPSMSIQDEQSIKIEDEE